MQKIVPHLWFNNQAVEAANFYVHTFGGTITHQSVIKDTPSGDCDLIGFEVLNFRFEAISAGPQFTITPAISFSVNLRTKEETKALWEKLTDGGEVLMPLRAYPFSDFYGWCNDKYGVSWQLIALGDTKGDRPNITPALMFTQHYAGKAEEAMQFYTTLFKNSRINNTWRHDGTGVDAKNTLAHAEFILDNQEFMVLDSADAHKFTFTEGVSLIVHCKDQAEIDHFWEKLTENGGAPSMCGWLKDQYGVSWQIVPGNLSALMEKDPSKTTPALLQMKKIVIADLQAAAKN